MSFFREAVDHFLFCDFCRDHFLRAYDGGDGADVGEGVLL
jgi:hypothetical protein